MQVNGVFFVLSAVLVPVASVLRGAGEQTLMNDMRPEVVRKLLSTVEQEWIHSRAMVLSNVTDNDEAFSEMEKSCVKVSGAIIAGSEGQKDRVVEYMQDVCGGDGPHDMYSLCSNFASGVEAEMTDDSEYNRDELHLSKFCRKFWNKDVANVALAEAKQQAQEVAEAEKARKEKEEAAEAAQKAEEEARAKAEEEAKAKAAEEAKAAEAAMAAAAPTNQTLTPTSEAQSNQTTAVSVSAETNATASPAQEATEHTDSNSTGQPAPTNSTTRTTDNSATEATSANSTTNATPVKNINGSYSAKLAAVVKSAVAVKK